MEKIAKNAVIATARKDLERYRESGAWLNKASQFEHSLCLIYEQKKRLLPVFENCNLSSRKENLVNFEILMANLMAAFFQHKKKPLTVSMSPNEWKKTRYQQTGSSTIQIINLLHEGGYLKMKKGYKTKKESRYTRVWPMDKLIAYFRELPRHIRYEPIELVELRDEKGNLKEYKDTNYTRNIRNILKKANNVNEQAEIRLGEYTLSASLVAIFDRKFSLYGRLHTRGYRHYQGFSEDERTEITINGDSIIELDFTALHPHLLYAKENIQYFGDPYSVIDKRPETRAYLKILFLCMLNSEDYKTTERAANYWLYQNHNKRERLKKLGISKARPIMNAFIDKHKTIARYFFSGKDSGLKVMNKDAQIALDIVNHFVKKNIPILAVHDSFIVQKKYQSALRETMKRIYKKHTKGFRCPVK